MPHSAIARRFVEIFVKPDTEGQEHERRWYLATCLLVALPVVSGFVLADVVGGRTVEAAVTLAFGVAGAVALVLNRVADDARLGFRLSAVAVLNLLTWLLYIGAGAEFAFVWFYILPLPMYYCFGQREGAFWFGLSLVLSLGVLAAPLGATYSTAASARFAVTYGLVGLLGFGLEHSRATLHQKIRDEKLELEIALGEVRTLSALLPMCAWCRKVRSDDGFWSQIEEYLNTHTGTVVSHGLCPECATKIAEEDDFPTPPQPDEQTATKS